MKLQDRLPQGVTVGGRFYRLDFDFRNVLRMIDELDRQDLMPEAKAYRALRCLTRHPRNVGPVLEAVKALLFHKKATDGPRITDFEQDAGLIRAAFWQAYRIDLYTDRLHYLAFIELLNAIPEGTRYSYVVGIRARPIPSPTKYNAEERAWLMKAKADVALHYEENEQEQAERYSRDVANIAAALIGWAGAKNG
jgi:hypothetical protein